MPSGVGPNKAEIPAGENMATIKLTAAADARPGAQKDVSVIGTIPDVEQQVALQKFDLNVSSTTARTPFDLTLESPLVKVAQGGEAIVKLTAKRGSYTGPIAVEIQNLQEKVKAETVIIPADQSSIDVKLTATNDAVPGDAPKVVASGKTSDPDVKPIPSAPITVRVTNLFDLVIDPNTVKIAQSGKASLKVNVTRNGYIGTIDVELKNLPTGVTTALSKVSIAKDQSAAQVDLTATDAAALGDTKTVTAACTAVDASNRVIVSDPFTISVGSALVLFDYQLDPSPIQVPLGGTKRFTVTVVRKTYQGPITLNVVNLPAKVTVTAGLILKNASTVDLDMTAAADAVLGDKKDVTFVGSATDAANKSLESQPFTVSVIPASGIDLTVDATNPYRMKQGASTNVVVTAVRRGYDGPIDVTLQGLPLLVTAPPATIPQGQTTVVITLSADLRATAGDKPTIAVGTAAALGTKKFSSGQFVVGVLGTPTFQLVAGPKVIVQQGTTSILTVTVIRQNFDGNIDVILQGLPARVSAPVGTILKGQTTVNIPLTAQGNATVGDMNGIVVSGNAASVGLTGVLSQGFTVTVAGKPVTAGSFTLKADHMKIKQNNNATLTVHVTRTGGFNGPVTITAMKNLPGGLSFTPFVIPAGQTKGTTTISAAATAATTTNKMVQVHGSSADNTLQVDSPQFEVDVSKK